MDLFAMTSLLFMLDWVPDPVCQTTRGKCSMSLPSATSPAAWTIALPTLESMLPWSMFTCKNRTTWSHRCVLSVCNAVNVNVHVIHCGGEGRQRMGWDMPIRVEHCATASWWSLIEHVWSAVSG